MREIFLHNCQDSKGRKKLFTVVHEKVISAGTLKKKRWGYRESKGRKYTWKIQIRCQRKMMTPSSCKQKKYKWQDITVRFWIFIHSTDCHPFLDCLTLTNLISCSMNKIRKMSKKFVTFRGLICEKWNCINHSHDKSNKLSKISRSKKYILKHFFVQKNQTM